MCDSNNDCVVVSNHTVFVKNWPKCSRNKIFHHYLQDYLLSGKNQSSNLWWLIVFQLPFLVLIRTHALVLVIMNIIMHNYYRCPLVVN